MSEKVAFALREGEELAGGSVSVGDGETLDVAAALDEGKGRIVVDAGSREERALGDYPALKRVAVSEPKSKSGKAAEKEEE